MSKIPIKAVLRMNFIEFKDKVVKIKNLPLPGMSAHFDMAPPIRQELMKEAQHSITRAKRAAVVALYYPDEKKNTRMLLILRNKYPGVHSNQIGFPGGKMEDHDDGLLQTALRETEEEVGVPREAIEVVRRLSDIYIPPSNFMVTPFFGLYGDPKPFRIDTTEVQRVVSVDLDDFLNDANLTVESMQTSYAKRIEVPAYTLSGHLVWGATAMMLSEIRQLLQQVL